MPLGTAIHNIEITLGKGGQLARAAGAVAKLIAKEGKSATLKLPSGEVRLISKNCSATVGQVGNAGVNQKSLGRAGSKCWLGKRPVVRGVVMNPFLQKSHVNNDIFQIAKVANLKADNSLIVF
ncbi:50S ribosomal protein L2 [Cucumis melo var. makuwa]|uniref:50S ribosomal protein L2 n=1 Tax=Cucumis melo var. makuwa TaxID=1194695 RepID=A0A5A7VK89_CUCMM|nr:50S ribosomal protein L2 [Cucumis melo var. makuwa]